MPTTFHNANEIRMKMNSKKNVKKKKYTKQTLFLALVTAFTFVVFFFFFSMKISEARYNLGLELQPAST